MMSRAVLQGAVGLNQLNLITDVRLVQQLLNKHSFVTRKTLAVDGNFGLETLLALLTFQRKVLVMHLPDGVVNVFGLTIDRLENIEYKADDCIAPGTSDPSKHIGHTYR